MLEAIQGDGGVRLDFAGHTRGGKGDRPIHEFTVDCPAKPSCSETQRQEQSGRFQLFRKSRG